MELEPVHRSRPGLVWPARVDRAGERGPTRWQAQGSDWTRVGRGLYLPADREISVEQRIVNAAAFLPAKGAVIGWAALRWRGGTWFDGTTDAGRTTLPVTLVTGEWDIRPQQGLAVSAEGMRRSETHHVVDGVRVTSAPWALLFEMRYATSIREAVVAYDMAAYSDLVSTEEAARAARWLTNMTGIPKARKALALVDENSWSPQETRLRLIWTLDALLPRPECNLPIFDGYGRHVATPDLLDVTAGLAIEYDGRDHFNPKQRRRDLLREEVIRDHGLDYLTVTGEDMHRPASLVRRLCSARRRALGRREVQRRWTVLPPPGWKPRRTVAERRLTPIRSTA